MDKRSVLNTIGQYITIGGFLLSLAGSVYAVGVVRGNIDVRLSTVEDEMKGRRADRDLLIEVKTRLAGVEARSSEIREEVRGVRDLIEKHVAGPK
jgi:hypothetical protein